MPRKKRGQEPEQSGSGEGEMAGEEMVSLDEAARALGVSRSTFQRMLAQGRVRGFKVGRQWRFRRDDLEKFTRMAHPSAAGVNVEEIGALVESMVGQAGPIGEVRFDPELAEAATEEEAAVERVLRALLALAVRDNASDIHIDPVRTATNVRLRIDGVLHVVSEMPRYVQKPLVACVKQHADLLVDQEQTSQDGRFRFILDGTEYDTRISTLPAVYGESVVMRLLPQAAQLVTLDSAERLGMSAPDLERFRRLLRAPCGLVLVAGPSGSGKTTLMYAGLQHIANSELKVITVEDPVEYAFPWVTQAAVNVKAGFTYEQALRAIARHDPDVIMVGDMRTPPVADLASRLAMTGHLVMSVVHASSAAGTVERLMDMGVEPFVLAESLICVVSMRLLRKVCPHCGQPDQPPYSVLSSLIERAKAGGYQLPENPKFVRGTGCDACRRSGYYGRTGIYEVMEVSPEVRRQIASRASSEAVQAAAVRNGMTTLAADALRKAAEGITSVVEAARMAPAEG